MISRLLFISALALSNDVLADASIPLPPPDVPVTLRDLARERANLQLVYRFYIDFFVKHDLSVAERVVAPSYIQHNPDVPDGRAAFVSYFSADFAQHPQASASIVQYGTFGDRVFLHVHSTKDPSDRGQAIVDIFRVEHGQIVEHWDAVQEVPAKAANGNTMF